MSIPRSILAVLWIGIPATLLIAQPRPHYREYRMGDDLLSVSRQIGVPPPVVAAEGGGPRENTVTELRWRSDYVRRGADGPTDTVERLIFSFHDDRLFRIVIDYSRSRTDGMHEGDMVEAVSKVYGQPAKRLDPPQSVGLEPLRPADSVVAQWSNEEIHVALLRLDDAPAFRLIVASTPLESLARAAGHQEAPIDLHDWALADIGRAADADRTAAAQSRDANIRSFIP